MRAEGAKDLPNNPYPDKMKTTTILLYSFAELSPSAQDRVIATKSRLVLEDPDNFTLSDCVASLKAIASAMGCPLWGWNIGPYNGQNDAFADIPSHMQWDLSGGNRTLVSFLRCLMHHGYSRPARFVDMVFPGICGFTGMCYDEDIAQTIWDALLDGDEFQSAINKAARRIGEICEEDLEYRASREGILEMLDASEEIYTESGEIF